MSLSYYRHIYQKNKVLPSLSSTVTCLLPNANPPSPIPKSFFAWNPNPLLVLTCLCSSKTRPIIWVSTLPSVGVDTSFVSYSSFVASQIALTGIRYAFNLTDLPTNYWVNVVQVLQVVCWSQILKFSTQLSQFGLFVDGKFGQTDPWIPLKTIWVQRKTTGESFRNPFFWWIKFPEPLYIKKQNPNFSNFLSAI